jgi:hypothetical protein
MNRTFNKAANYKEAELWDIMQQIRMTPKQRQKIADKLKKRFFGQNNPDVRETRNCNNLFFKLNINSNE